MAQGDILYRGSSAWARLAAGTASNVLMTNGASANPQWATWASLANTTYVLYANSDLPKTNDVTLAADTAFDATLKANKKYRLKYDIYWDVNAAPDLLWDVNFTGTTTSISIKSFKSEYATASLGTGTSGGTLLMRGASVGTLSYADTTGAATTFSEIITVGIEVGASGGTMSLRWAQNTTSGTATTRRRNSSVMVTEIS